jgi:hypothetical protein
METNEYPTIPKHKYVSDLYACFQAISTKAYFLFKVMVLEDSHASLFKAGVKRYGSITSIGHGLGRR